MPTAPNDPQHVAVTRDLDTLSFALTDWSAALRRAALVVALFLGVGVGGAAVAAGPEVLPQLPILAGWILPFTLFVLYASRGRFRIEVRIDSFGAGVSGRHRQERFRWSDFDAVERRGRRLFLDGPRGRVELPTPSSYVDAAWMERVVREGVESVGVADGTPPRELQVLRGVDSERR